MQLTRRLLLKLGALLFWRSSSTAVAQDGQAEPSQPFGTEFPNLDSLAVGEWWKKPAPKGPNAPPPMNVPRDQVIAFALYTHEAGVLKLTAQLYPLMPGEPSGMPGSETPLILGFSASSLSMIFAGTWPSTT